MINSLGLRPVLECRYGYSSQPIRWRHYNSEFNVANPFRPASAAERAWSLVTMMHRQLIVKTR